MRGKIVDYELEQAIRIKRNTLKDLFRTDSRNFIEEIKKIRKDGASYSEAIEILYQREITD